MSNETEVAGNALPSGVSLSQIEEAISQSGYPLQTATSELLREEFRVLPEWGYRDRITGDLRTLDILAVDSLVPPGSKQTSKVYPFLSLLIECKQSSSPYVFFSEQVGLNAHIARIPMICGLPAEMSISTDDSEHIYRMPLLDVLRFRKAAFVSDAPRCSVFSKCVRKGRGYELSGTEAYNNIVMPMMSAMEHFKRVSVSNDAVRYRYRPVFIVIAVSIVDAPMVAYDINKQTEKINFTTWHRVIRNEPGEEDESSGYLGHMGFQTAVDIVHRNFFGTYLTNYVRPLAKNFSELLLRYDSQFTSGTIRVKDYGADRVSDIWTRIIED